jgi:hypothetical protein
MAASKTPAGHRRGDAAAACATHRSHHLHFVFTGVIDADGFAVYEELAASGE